MQRATLALAITACLFTALVGTADARALTKRDARQGTIKFMAKIAWAFDEAQAGEKVHVRPAPRCVRLSHVTVTCPIVVRLPSTGAVLRGYLRVHRTRQNLLGYLLPWDPGAVRATLGQAASTESVSDPVHVGVEQP